MNRIWIYQADRLLTDLESSQISEELNAFAAQWKVHGSPLHASGEVLLNAFLILKVDQDFAEASGCSIDSSVRFMKGIEDKYQIKLFDRMQIAYQKNDALQIVSRDEFEKLIAEGVIKDDTIVFDNTITTERDMVEKWAIPFKDSWHKRVFS